MHPSFTLIFRHIVLRNAPLRFPSPRWCSAINFNSILAKMLSASAICISSRLRARSFPLKQSVSYSHFISTAPDEREKCKSQQHLILFAKWCRVEVLYQVDHLLYRFKIESRTQSVILVGWQAPGEWERAEARTLAACNHPLMPIWKINGAPTINAVSRRRIHYSKTTHAQEVEAVYLIINTQRLLSRQPPQTLSENKSQILCVIWIRYCYGIAKFAFWRLFIKISEILLSNVKTAG